MPARGAAMNTHARNDSTVSRRSALNAMAGLAAAAHAAPKGSPEKAGRGAGRIRQSVSYWCFKGIPLPEFCGHVKDIGLAGVDLLSKPQWETVTSRGLMVTMANGPGNIPLGWNDPRNHDRLTRRSEELLPKVA